MTSYASTTTATSGTDARVYAVVILFAVIVTACYFLGCWLYPFGICRRCKGSGKRRSPFGRSFGLCRRCDGDGRRLRISRHIINALRETHDKGNR